MPKLLTPYSKEELQATLAQWPGGAEFSELADPDPDRFIMWSCGHCFLWIREPEGWDCDEL